MAAIIQPGSPLPTLPTLKTPMVNTVELSSQRQSVHEEHIADFRELLRKTDDGSVLLVPGDEDYENSLRRWSAAAEQPAVSVAVVLFLYQSCVKPTREPR